MITGLLVELGGRRAAAPALGVAVLLLGTFVGEGRAQEPVAEPPEVVGAALDAQVDVNAGAATVQIRYRLRTRGAALVPVKGLEFFGTRIRDIEVREGASGRVLPLDGQREASGRYQGSFSVPVETDADGVLEVVVSYGLDAPSWTRDGSFDVTVPLLMVDWAPEASREDLFGARIVLPEPYFISEAFPMVPRTVEGTGPDRTHVLGLPVVPSMVRLRGQVGARPFLTLGRAIDFGVVLVLLALSIAGWRALKRAESENRRFGTRGDS